MEVVQKETDKRKNAKNQFLTAIDLYCKYEINGHLDEELSSNNTEFFKGAIQCFKDDIKKDLKGFDNIDKYIKKYHIPLDQQESALGSPISQTLYLSIQLIIKK